MDALEEAFKWVSDLHKDYSPNSDYGFRCS